MKSAADKHPCRILVVDDEKIVREVIGNALDKPSVFLVEAEDGEAAIELILRETFDLLIVDKNLPGITGLDVIRRAKAVDRRVGALLITAYASRESVEEAMAIGVDDYLIKPFNVSDLVNKVKEAWDRRQELDNPGRSPGPSLPTRQVMVCLPEDSSRPALLKALEVLGQQVKLATDLSELLTAIRKKQVDAIVCDLTTLNRDNAIACFLRGSLLLSPDLLFIAVADRRQLDGAVEALRFGAGKVIYRPIVDSQELADSLRFFFGRRGSTSAPSQR